MHDTKSNPDKACPRCRRRLGNHATAIVDNRIRMRICPRAKGYSAGEDNAVIQIPE